MLTSGTSLLTPKAIMRALNCFVYTETGKINQTVQETTLFLRMLYNAPFKLWYSEEVLRYYIAMIAPFISLPSAEARSGFKALDQSLDRGMFDSAGLFAGGVVQIWTHCGKTQLGLWLTGTCCSNGAALQCP